MTLKEQMLKADRHTYRSDILYRYGLEIAMLYSILEWGTYQGDTKRLFTAKEIAEAIGKSEKWVRRYLRKMEQLGLIEIEGVHSKGYHITLLLVDNLTRSEETYVDKLTRISGQIDQIYVDKLTTLVDKLTTISGQNDQKHPQQMQSETGLGGPLKNIKNIKENIYIEDIEAKSTSANASAHSSSGGDTQKPFEKGKASPSVKEKKDPHPPTSAAPPSPTGEDAVPFFDGPLADPVVEVLKAYNEEYARPLGRREVSLRVSPTRKKRIKHLLKTYTVEDFRKVFQIARENPFLRGDVKDWHFTLSWLLKNDDNMDKILEGYYDDKAPARPVRQPTITDEKEEEMLKHDAEILLKFAELDEDIDNLGTSIDKDAV